MGSVTIKRHTIGTQHTWLKTSIYQTASTSYLSNFHLFVNSSYSSKLLCLFVFLLCVLFLHLLCFVSPPLPSFGDDKNPVISGDQWKRTFLFKEPQCAADATLSGLWRSLCWQGAVIWGRGGAGCLTPAFSGNPCSMHIIETLAVTQGGAGGVMALSGVGEGA